MGEEGERGGNCGVGGGGTVEEAVRKACGGSCSVRQRWKEQVEGIVEVMEVGC